jgi:hypothetical protein
LNHRLAELGLHLDLEEVPKMAADSRLIHWFLVGQLQEEDFVVGRDWYLMPTYVPMSRLARWLREQAAALLEEVMVWYDGAWCSLLAAHRRRLAQLHDGLLAGQPARYLPLMYLSKDLPQEQRARLAWVGEELRERLQAPVAQRTQVRRLLDVWEAWLQT